jgi:hypothetical protein
MFNSQRSTVLWLEGSYYCWNKEYTQDIETKMAECENPMRGGIVTYAFVTARIKYEVVA